MSNTDYSNVDTSKYSKDYSDSNFWKKVKEFALKAGAKVIYTALKLYYASKSPDTPAWAKAVIYGALGYFISPIDLIPDPLPGGFVDDLGVMLAALVTVSAYITDEVRRQAKEKMKEWFGDYDLAEIE